MLLALAAGCGPKIEQLEAKQEGNVFVLRGRVTGGSVGSVQVSGWGGDDYVVAEKEPGSGSFKARVPLYLLASGKLNLRIQAKATEHMGTAMAESQLEVDVPAHAEIGIVDCDKEEEEEEEGPPGDDPFAVQRAKVFVGSAAIVNEEHGLSCPLVNGRLELNVRGAAGAELRLDGEATKLGEDGKAKLQVPVTRWLQTLPLAGFAVKLDPTSGKTRWISSDAAVVEAEKVAIDVTAGDQRGQLTFEVGSDLAEPVDAENEGRVSTRVGELLNLARTYLAAARAGKVPAVDEPPRNTAVVLVLGEKVDPHPSFISTNMYSFGDAKTLGDVARFAVATQGATKSIKRCGPYRERGDSSGRARTIDRTQLDMNVQAWTRRGGAFSQGVVQGGDGCPEFTTLELVDNDAYVDGPPTHALGAWVLNQDEP